MRLGPDRSSPLVEVVGIVGDVRNDRARADAEPMVYVPTRRSAPFLTQYLIRADGDVLALARAAERELAALDGGLVLEGATLLTEVAGQGLVSRQLPTVLIGAFGALALLLASVGVYAMFVSMVAAREGEFAVRMALGSRPAAVARLVLRAGRRLARGRTRRRRRRARVGCPAAAWSALRRIAVRPSCPRRCDRGAGRVRGGGAADTAAPRDVCRAGRRACARSRPPTPLQPHE